MGETTREHTLITFKGEANLEAIFHGYVTSGQIDKQLWHKERRDLLMTLSWR